MNMAQLNEKFADFQVRLKSQFSNLDPNDPSQWPIFPQAALMVGIFLAAAAGLWFALFQNVSEELSIQQQKEIDLKAAYVDKLGQAVNLGELKKQLEQVKQYVNQLERQLPSKAEMDALLSDINQAGLGRSLQFEVFRPGQVVVKEYYAELPIAIRVTGSYHDVGNFSADIANLSRIVTLNDLGLTPIKDRAGMLTLEGVAKTFRYLDTDEIAAQKKAVTK
jgi:type IV pilus assembly protein PilO